MSLPNYMEPVDDVNNNNNGDAENSENNTNMNGGASFGDDEFDSENQEDGRSQNPRQGKRKRYHRHTPQQIQDMENFFKECPHPDDKQRKELGHQLGLDHLQIKFWFQNKRTQNKNHQERHENLLLREENSMLIAANHHFREALAIAPCPICGGRTAVGEMSSEERYLLLENAKLTKEIRQLSEMATKYTSKPVMSYPFMPHPNQAPAFEPPMMTNGNMGNLSMSNFGVKEADKPLVIELALAAMSELKALAQINEPLWKGGDYGTILDLNEYTRSFQNGLGPRPIGFRTEASRETAVVFMQEMDIVHRLMDVNLWSTMFAGMVGRAMTHDTLLTGVHGNLDGTIHLITAEYQVLSPLVSTRKCYFLRYCKQQLGEGLWAVVDISIDHLVPNLEIKCRRRPSGCLIKLMPNGFSRVTWVEHVEVDDRGEVHKMFKHLLNSGQALGASRWVGTLERQCERLGIMMAPNIPSIESDNQITVTNKAKQSMLKLAERMSRGFFDGVKTSSTAELWCNLPDYTGDNVRVMTRKSFNDPGRPDGLSVCAAHSFWVPAPHITVFDYLRDENNRSNWDVLFIGGNPQRLTHIFNGRDNWNSVSLLRSPNNSQSEMMIIQESSTEPTASFLVYAPVAATSMEKVFNGGDPEYVPLLPSGFAILPDGMAQPGKAGGSLVNVSVQMLVDSSPAGMVTFSSVSTIESLILAAANKIRAYFAQQTA